VPAGPVVIPDGVALRALAGAVQREFQKADTS